MIANRSCHIKRVFGGFCFLLLFFFKKGSFSLSDLSPSFLWRKKLHLTRQVCWTTDDRKLLLIKFYYQVRELLIWLLKNTE